MPAVRAAESSLNACRLALLSLGAVRPQHVEDRAAAHLRLRRQTGPPAAHRAEITDLRRAVLSARGSAAPAAEPQTAALHPQRDERRSPQPPDHADRLRLRRCCGPRPTAAARTLSESDERSGSTPGIAELAHVGAPLRLKQIDWIAPAAFCSSTSSGRAARSAARHRRRSAARSRARSKRSARRPPPPPRPPARCAAPTRAQVGDHQLAEAHAIVELGEWVSAPWHTRRACLDDRRRAQQPHEPSTESSA